MAKETNVADLTAKLAGMLNGSAKTEAADEVAPAKKTVSRSNFKGELVWGTVGINIPVKTFTAVDVDKVERHMYHDCGDDKGGLHSLKQGAMTCSGCGESVDKKSAIYGVTVGEKIVPVTDEEMKSVMPMRDGKMSIVEFIDESEINPIYYEDAEFVVPDGTAPVLTAFATLVASLQRTGKVAKGVRVKSGREQYFVLRPYGQHGLTLNYLRAEYEVRNCDKWAPTAVDEKLVDVMASLIEATAVPFTAAPQDRGLAAQRKLIKQKAAGVEVTKPEVEVEQKAAANMMDALTQALAMAKAAKACK